jgi:hypothetical protein
MFLTQGGAIMLKVFPKIGQPGFTFSGAVEYAKRNGLEPPMLVVHRTQQGAENLKAFLMQHGGFTQDQVVTGQRHDRKKKSFYSLPKNVRERMEALDEGGYSYFAYVQNPTCEQAARCYQALQAEIAAVTH